MAQYYALSYKGKMLGSPMLKDEAEAKLMIMQRCLRGLELIELPEDGPLEGMGEGKPLQDSAM